MANKFYSEQVVLNWDDLKRKLGTFQSNWAFRGQGDADWGLQTSIERTWPKAERDIAEQAVLALYHRKAKGLRTNQPPPTDTLMTLAEMQHFGAPTRLQDWTKSFYVAAYFSFEASRQSKSIAIWAINLSWLKAQAVPKIKKTNTSFVGLTVRDSLNAPNIFDNVVLKNSEQFVLPVSAFEVNERLGIQQGLFLCPGDVRETLEDNLCTAKKSELLKECYKFVVPYKCRATVLADLRRMNITAATLFPGLDGFSRSLNNELFLLMNDAATLNKLRGGVAGALNYF